MYEHKNYFEMHPVCKHVAIDWECRTAKTLKSELAKGWTKVQNKTGQTFEARWINSHFSIKLGTNVDDRIVLDNEFDKVIEIAGLKLA